ncbi:hypothetical protein [Acidovorax carolinensis]|nr:hypothetical protein [Acidovorax carolinensis]
MNAITPQDIISDVTDQSLLGLALELQEWMRHGKTDGLLLEALGKELTSDCGLSEEGVMQVVESLVVREVMERWIRGQKHAAPLEPRP